MKSFSEFTLSSELQRAIQELGYETPSPIQAEAIPLLLSEGRTDFLGLAGTGTGKTAAFGIPMLEKIDAKVRAVQSLILCPTRELAMQVSNQINLLGKFKGVKAIPVYGGASFGDQVYGLKNGGQVVVGTPGRVIEHIQKGTLALGNLKVVILDEADEMVSMGFKDELETILQAVPRETCDIWLFSATMSREVRRVADTYLKNPQMVQLNRKEILSENVEQFFYVTQEGNKPQILCKLIEAAEDFYGLVFCQTKALVGDLTTYLNERGFKTACLHGDIDQSSRERTMQAFRDRRVQILVCTDVAARGLDVKDITHVVNYSIPRELDSYVHRIGRTARSGKSGFAMSLVTPANRRMIERIEFMTKSKMKPGVIPSSRDIGMKKVGALYERFDNQKNFGRVTQMLNEEWMKRIETMNPDEIVARLLGVFMPDMVSEGPDRVVLGVSANSGSGRPSDRSDRNGPGKPFNRSGGGGGGGGGGGRFSRGGDKPHWKSKGPRRAEKRPDSRQ